MTFIDLFFFGKRRYQILSILPKIYKNKTYHILDSTGIKYCQRVIPSTLIGLQSSVLLIIPMSHIDPVHPVSHPL